MRENLALVSQPQARVLLARAWSELIVPALAEGKRLWFHVRSDTRSLAQNARMWAMLTDVSKQVEWYEHRLTPQEWKDVFTAALKGQKRVPGLNGNFVVLGTSTSQMTVAEMGDLMELMSAFGADNGVVFSDPNDFSQHLEIQ
jgi:hypothetical protein